MRLPVSPRGHRRVGTDLTIRPLVLAYAAANYAGVPDRRNREANQAAKEVPLGSPMTADWSSDLSAVPIAPEEAVRDHLLSFAR